MLQARISEFMQQDGRKKICLKESEVWQKVISNKITVTLVTQGLQSSFLSCSLLRPPFFSGQLLFFSSYCEGVWGWCLMPLGEPGPVTPLFAIPLFFFKHL